jgi:RNA polymerase sigma factor (sigma-70 family)
MKLNEAQQRIVSENMGLVGKVIKDKVHGVNQLGVYTYDDIFQIGCIGLCKAAATDRGGCFSTYAYRLIWNEICSALIYASRRSTTECAADPEVLLGCTLDAGVWDDYEGIDSILDKALKETSGVTAKGIRAIRLMADGYNSREIGEQMGASANNVTAWVSKARSYLKQRPELQGLDGEYGR